MQGAPEGKIKSTSHPPLNLILYHSFFVSHPYHSFFKTYKQYQAGTRPFVSQTHNLYYDTYSCLVVCVGGDSDRALCLCRVLRHLVITRGIHLIISHSNCILTTLLHLPILLVLLAPALE
jgi:hypothetical protein